MFARILFLLRDAETNRLAAEAKALRDERLEREKALDSRRAGV